MKDAILLFTLAFITAGAAVAEDTQFRIPTDAKAIYTVIERSGTGRIRTIVTKREGPSGTSYSKRQYDCDQNTWKYLGTGDTMEAMGASKPEKSMTPALAGSIASFVGGVACRN